MPPNEMKLAIKEYRGYLVCDTLRPERDDNFIPPGPTPKGGFNLGVTLLDTAKFLGISKEAYKLLIKIPKGRDAIGEISMFMANDGRGCLGWLGGFKKLIDPKHPDVERARDDTDDLPHIVIPNELDPEVVKELDEVIDSPDE